MVRTNLNGDRFHRGMMNVGGEPRWCRPCMEYHNPQASLLNTQLREQVNDDRLVVGSLWRGPCRIQNFILDGLSFRPKLAIPQKPQMKSTASWTYVFT